VKPLLKKILIGVGATVAVLAAGGGIFLWAQTSGYEAGMAKVYAQPVPDVKVSTDPAVLARGKHLAFSLTACATSDCHGTDLGGGEPIVMGPLGTLVGPNITQGGLGAAYTDGELARLLTSGIKKDGRSVRFMPVQDFAWLPDADIAAVVSYVRSVPAVDKPSAPSEVGLLGKVLDHNRKIVLNVARYLEEHPREVAPPPAPTVAYGRFVAKLCTGCHGETFGGGPIPGAPADLPIPTNLTPHETGLKAWSYDDFARLLDSGIKKNGETLNPFMPLPALTAMDETERKALWAFLQSTPPLVFGSR
jgi:mono/diheme cytochrome c family protein